MSDQCFCWWRTLTSLQIKFLQQTGIDFYGVFALDLVSLGIFSVTVKLYFLETYLIVKSLNIVMSSFLFPVIFLKLSVASFII